MSFFDDLPAPPARPRQPRFVPPPWAGPPSDELPAVVPLGSFLQRTPRMVLAAKAAEVYSTGCTVELVWTIRRGTESDAEWGALTERCFNRASFRYGSQSDRGGFRLGVAYADGGKATADEWPHWGLEGADPGPGPVLTTAGGGAGSGSEDEVTSSMKLWMWPLPPPGELRVVAEWADLGLAQVAIAVDGGELASAAERVQPYWLTPD
ncbi:MAG: hypothetical protein ABWX69_05920 [Arthrobacter sp.]